MLTTFFKWFNDLVKELLSVHQSVHVVAFSFAMGVFLGVLPFTGVVAAISLAWVLRLNKAAAILGSAITNTWVGIIVFGLSIKVAVWYLKIDAATVLKECEHLWRDFHWQELFSSSVVHLIAPVGIAFVALSLVCAFFAYFFVYALLSWYRKHHPVP